MAGACKKSNIYIFTFASYELFVNHILEYVSQAGRIFVIEILIQWSWCQVALSQSYPSQVLMNKTSETNICLSTCILSIVPFRPRIIDKKKMQTLDGRSYLIKRLAS